MHAPTTGAKHLINGLNDIFKALFSFLHDIPIPAFIKTVLYHPLAESLAAFWSGPLPYPYSHIIELLCLSFYALHLFLRKKACEVRMCMYVRLRWYATRV